MAVSESLEMQALRELAAEKCACGAPKEPNRPFCHVCYFDLPVELRRNLYRTVSEGYASAYDEAKDWLRVNG